MTASPPPLANGLRELLAVPTVALAPFRSAIKVEPFGGGRTAFVIPGMFANDLTTSLLRRSLMQAGFHAVGWGDGLNAVVDEASVDRVLGRLREAVQSNGKPALLVGWSLGGFYARILAQRAPECAALVVTLGSPFSGDRHANRAWKLFELINRYPVDDPPFTEDPATKPMARTVAVWSAKDGIVAPQSSKGTEAERDAEYCIGAKHLEMATSPQAVRSILDIVRREIALVSKA